MKALHWAAAACLLSPLGPKLIYILPYVNSSLSLFILLCVFKAYLNYGSDHAHSETVIVPN